MRIGRYVRAIPLLLNSTPASFLFHFAWHRHFPFIHPEPTEVDHCFINMRTSLCPSPFSLNLPLRGLHIIPNQTSNGQVFPTTSPRRPPKRPLPRSSRQSSQPQARWKKRRGSFVSLLAASWPAHRRAIVNIDDTRIWISQGCTDPCHPRGTLCIIVDWVLLPAARRALVHALEDGIEGLRRRMVGVGYSCAIACSGLRSTTSILLVSAARENWETKRRTKLARG